MNRFVRITWIVVIANLLVICCTTPLRAAETAKPNIILIMADDLGFGEIGYYGQRLIQTPEIDELAANGMAFTQFYAGATVCAPSRCTLMTGRHNGHATVRGNASRDNIAAQSLSEVDFTLAECMKERGYATACIGKWGLGEVDQPGHPLRQGFDRFYGYLSQVHAHNYFPSYLFDDMNRLPLANQVTFMNPDLGDVGGGYATEQITYSHDLFVEEALRFITVPRSEPFFMYLALTIPHGNNEANRVLGNGAEVPNWSRYDNTDWPLQNKQHAAMITRMDESIGKIVDQLRRIGLEENTLILFTSDNGPHNESGHQLDLFEPSGPLRGIKRSLYEGGIRVPMIAYWKGTIAPGAVSDHIGYSGDFFATFADLAGAPCDKERGPIDSVSFASTLFTDTESKVVAQQETHEYLYFEFYEQGSRQAVRFGDWKAIREPMITGDVKLYNLAEDIGEERDVAANHPSQVLLAAKYMNEAHEPSDRWPVPKAAVQGAREP